MLGITDLKVGAKIVLEGHPFLVTWSQHSKQARGAGVMKTKMRNLITGATVEKTFQGNDKIEEADISFSRAQFLYRNVDDFEFMDQTSFETINFTTEQLGDTAYFLTDGMDVDIQYFDSKPINVQLPPKMTFEVTQTDPGVRGDTATGGSKPATIITGFEVKVPLFINPGDKIVINTDTREYCERAKG